MERGAATAKRRLEKEGHNQVRSSSVRLGANKGGGDHVATFHRSCLRRPEACSSPLGEFIAQFIMQTVATTAESSPEWMALLRNKTNLFRKHPREGKEREGVVRCGQGTNPRRRRRRG